VEMERVKAAEATLKKAGFAVSKRCCSRPSCFDIAARKSSSLILIKFQSDIGSISAGDSLELKLISECVSAVSLLISEKVREKPLEDDTVYSRYNALAVTHGTFENVVLREVYPLIQAGPGGYYIKIDGEAIKRRRQELGLSVGEIAEKIGISRRTLYGYERGTAKASVMVAYNLICTLGIPVAKPINIFEKSRRQRKQFLATAGRIMTKNKVLQRIFKKLVGYNIIAVKKAPFDFVITVPEEKMRIIGGVADDKEPRLENRVDEILSLSKVIQAHPVVITEKQRLLNKDVSCISSGELSKVKNPQDLL